MIYDMIERWIEKVDRLAEAFGIGLIALLIVCAVYAITAYTLYALFDPNTDNPEGSPVFAVLLTFPLFLLIGGAVGTVFFTNAWGKPGFAEKVMLSPGLIAVFFIQCVNGWEAVVLGETLEDFAGSVLVLLLPSLLGVFLAPWLGKRWIHAPQDDPPAEETAESANDRAN
ncbi:MAG TPA: hypothetical protein PL005_12005 [Candidatus Hydrogenedentes bacterium]|nr:hypothetical protein [Candidatus Hydrogenedentota bacterium]